jgi:hypothetical protein
MFFKITETPSRNLKKFENLETSPHLLTPPSVFPNIFPYTAVYHSAMYCPLIPSYIMEHTGGNPREYVHAVVRLNSYKKKKKQKHTNNYKKRSSSSNADHGRTILSNCTCTGAPMELNNILTTSTLPLLLPPPPPPSPRHHDDDRTYLLGPHPSQTGGQWSARTPAAFGS